MKRKFIVLMVIAILLSAFLPINAYAADALDEIQEYYIDIDVLDDGSANINYHFKWHVLDDQKEGPVEDLYIGIPNKHVDNIKALSENIESIKYTNSYNGSSGDYVKVVFPRKYYKDEVVEFEFSIHQSYLYTMNDRDKTVSYAFTPGWFPSTPINDLIVRWNGNYVIESNCDHTDENGMLVWQTSLDSGRDSKLSVNVKYDQSRFNKLDPEKQAEGNGAKIAIVVLLIIISVIIIALVIYACSGDDGYGGGGRTTFVSSHHYHSSCACASHCACACACAGGGRAGCSVKDFYTAVSDTELDKAFEKAKEKI